MPKLPKKRMQTDEYDKRIEKLPQDYDTPFSEPSDQKARLSPDHPETDTNIDSQELYDEGLAAAAEVDLPDRSAVTGYQPKTAKGNKSTKRHRQSRRGR